MEIDWTARASHAIREGMEDRNALRDSLIQMRDESMKNWPEGIPQTVFLSHLIWWLAD